jgi:hypothetical protein
MAVLINPGFLKWWVTNGVELDSIDIMKTTQADFDNLIAALRGCLMKKGCKAAQ